MDLKQSTSGAAIVAGTVVSRQEREEAGEAQAPNTRQVPVKTAAPKARTIRDYRLTFSSKRDWAQGNVKPMPVAGGGAKERARRAARMATNADG